MKLATYPFGKKEALTGNYVIATYHVFKIHISDVLNKAGGFAIGQTVGTWIKVPGITDEMIEKYQARVISVDLVSNEPKYIMRIAFPTINFAKSFASMLTGLLGNDVSTSLQVRLVDLELINDAAKDMGYIKNDISPIQKLRNITQVYDRPLILNMIKPCIGFDEKTGAEFFRQVALGGIDLIKDDELLTNPSYSQVTKRVHEYRKSALEVKEITGKETIYIPNITNRPSKMRESAKAIIDAGAKACMVNFVFTGFDAFAEICEEFGNDLFIMGHYAGVSVFSGTKSGITNPVYIGILPRICGADAVMTMYVKDINGIDGMDFWQNIQAQMCEYPDMNKIVTTVGGGITPLDIPEITNALGNDIIIGIGGAIQGHPFGATKGAEACMAAVKATATGVSLEMAATNCDSLKMAINTWST